MIREARGIPDREQVEQLARDLGREPVGVRLYIGRRARALGVVDSVPRMRGRRRVSVDSQEEGRSRRLSARSAANLARRMVELGRQIEGLMQRRAILDREIAQLRAEFEDAKARLAGLAPEEPKSPSEDEQVAQVG